MTDKPWKRNEPDSPCKDICLVHPETRLCTGCGRTIDEIAAWTSMSPETRQAIMAELPTRTPFPKRRRGGRAGRMKRIPKN